MKAEKMSPKRYKLKISEFGGISRTYPESTLPHRFSPNAYNFMFRNGCLKSDLGLAKATGFLTDIKLSFEIPELSGKEIVDLHFYHKYDYSAGRRDDRLLAVTKDSELWGINYCGRVVAPPAWAMCTDVAVAGKVCSVNYNHGGADVLIVSSEAGTYMMNGTRGEWIDCPRFNSLAKHNERIYGTTLDNKKQVWFSTSLDPTDWAVSSEKGGFINFNDEGGDVVKVVSFSSYLYIFREHEILRLKAFGEQTDFTLSKLWTAAGRIYPDTITLAGDRIIFLAEDGLYEFNGERAVSAAKDMTPYFAYPKETAAACWYEGKYFLAAKVKFPDGKKIHCENGAHRNNAVFEYDVLEGRFSVVRGIDACKLVAVNVGSESKILASNGSEHKNRCCMFVKTGKNMNEPLEKFWASSVSDLGHPSKRKVIREVYADVKGDVVLGIVADGKEYEFALDEARARVRTAVSGNLIGFYFKSQSVDAKVSAPTLYFDVV